FNVAELAAALAPRLAAVGRATLAEMTAGVSDRLELIVNFLAVLELYKEGRIDIDQAQRFGVITITWLGEGEGDR
ncbi:MAG: segregation/condensation protein A, partial [Acidimicrobiales bacterium]